MRNFSHFHIIHGDGEKLELAQILANTIKTDIVMISHYVDDVRLMIKLAHSTNVNTMFIIENADLMSIEACNSLLKIVEEPPENIYVCMLFDSGLNIIDTLYNRANIIKMDMYTKCELSELTKNKLILEYSDTPEQVRYWIDNESELINLIEFTETYLKQLPQMAGVQAFLLPLKLKIKDDDKGFNISDFLTVALKIKLKNFNESDKLSTFVKITTNSLNDLKRTSMKKEFILDRWITGIRNIYIKN